MDEPLNTISYFIAGFTVIFSAILLYMLSLYIRWRNLKQEEEILKDAESYSDD
jgi:hypothetical protein